MDTQDIRWKQRYENFKKVFHHLDAALKIESPDIVQKAGIIQFFEICVELSWKVMKDYLENQGFIDVKFPRSAIKKAFEVGLIENGHIWMELITDRNLTVHTYDEQKATELENIIRVKYFPVLAGLKNTFDNLTE
jgi:nucleotidyltransferase substrate binding protein (TIGR01987 family)